ncbi:MAG: type VI secretion system baseplate subunit TssF [Nannocystaceae bacterium]
MGSKHYESELAYLREMGREFALVHPTTAGLLAEKGSDPDVERLLEGVAFLTARIRERIDDAVPPVIHGLCQLLLPHYLRPVPATSIIQFSPQLRALRAVATVPRGTRVAAKPLQGTACEFRTTADIELLPLELADAALDETSANKPVIRLRFTTTEAGRAIVCRREGVRLFLHGEPSLTCSLYLWLRRYCRQVQLRCGAAAPVSLGADAIVPVGFGPGEAMLPWPAFAPDGMRILQEYFAQPSKFLFLDIKNLDRASLTEDSFEIAFTFERPPALPARITPETFRLFCTPVINLFDASADPIKRDPRVYEHLLRVSGVKPAHMEIYEVTSVVGVRQGQAQRKQYPPFFAYTHAAEGRNAAYHVVRPTSSPIDDAIDSYLAIVTPRDVPPLDVEEVLSIDVVATNRSLPADLQLGEVSTTPRGVAAPAPFRNITPLTVPARPALGNELHWRLLSHMGLSRSSLADAAVLRALLALYNFQREVSATAGRANELKIESIRRVTAEPITRMLEGAPVRGARVLVELDEARGGTAGEAFLFGCVLDELYGAQVTLNAMAELHVVLHPSKTEFRWPARSGRRAIL